ncbi:MAG: hypothetical protein ACOYOK_14830, partial [Pseudobdellovibrionaceae bacterium]
SLGASYQQRWSNKTTGLLGLNIQSPIHYSPISSGAQFSLKPLLMFDGFIGVEKKIHNDWAIGTFWYGQYNYIQFSYKDSSIDTSGSQTALFSSLELRLIYSF